MRLFRRDPQRHGLIDRTADLSDADQAHANVGFYVHRVNGSTSPFAVLCCDALPDLAPFGIAQRQFFPRWTCTRLGRRR
ncbi:MAG: hypothetical protein WKF73_11950 [Nocardioidaceae bacterium]